MGRPFRGGVSGDTFGDSWKNFAPENAQRSLQATVLMEATLTAISNSACGSDFIYDKSLIT